MKEKILLAIKAKFPAVNLSKKRLDAIAAKIESKCGTDETLIDAKIDEFNDYSPLTDIAKNDDKIRDLESKVKPPAKEKEKEEPVADPPITDDTPAWAKKMYQNQEKLEKQIAQLNAEKIQGTIKSEAAKLLKDVPEKFWGKRAIPEKLEDLEAFAAEVTADYAEIFQASTDKSILGVPGPKTGVLGTNTGKVDPDIVNFGKKQSEKITQKT